MAILEVLNTSNPETGLWLAGIAACAGLALAWRWWMTQRSVRYRALHMLGYARPATRAMPVGFRYAAIAAVAMATVFALTPVSPGISDEEASSSMTPTEPAPTVIIVEIGPESGVSVVLQGDRVEIRHAPLETPSVNVATAVSPTVGPITTVDATTVPVTVLPAEME
jgi:hypothetical protein